jgi:hypothetical protein
MGVTLALAGFHHGFFKAPQGFKPTPGLIIQAIGPKHRFQNNKRPLGQAPA